MTPFSSYSDEIAMLLGVPINAVTMKETLALIEKTIAERGHLQIGVVNAAKLVNMRHDPVLRQDVLSSDIVLADGAGVVWASRVLGRRLPERVPGIDLMMELLRVGNEKGYSIYCLGATEEISCEVARRISQDYPNVRMAGRRNGYFSEKEEAGVANDIAKSKADILFVAMSSPRKENFLHEWGDKIGVSICHGVGGSFDVYAGKVERAPVTWQKLGLEWLYRVKQEPGRLWRRYLVTNLLFVAYVAAEFWHADNAAPHGIRSHHIRSHQARLHQGGRS